MNPVKSLSHFLRPVLLFLILVFLSKDVLVAQSATAAFRQATTFSGFIKNIGQVQDQKNSSVNSVLYAGQVNGRKFFITDKGISFIFHKLKSSQVKKSALSPRDSSTSFSYELERTDITLLNAVIDPNQVIEADSEQESKYYFYDARFASPNTSLRLKKELLIKNIYPGVDWRIYITGSADAAALKYDFIVRPGADIARIKLRYSGNANPGLTSEGGIKIATRMGTITEKRPRSYLKETGEEKEVRFTLSKNIVGFNTGEYDQSHTLVIDPDVYWATYLAPISPSPEAGQLIGSDVRTDQAGNIFVQLSCSGRVPFPTVNPGNGAYYQNLSTSTVGSMILVKFSPAGVMLWSTYYGASKPIGGSKLTIDKSGNLCATAKFTDAYPAEGIVLVNSGGFQDTKIKKNFILKFDIDGRLTWSSYFGGQETGVTDMTSDDFGNFYVTGWSASNQFPTVNPGGGAFCVTAPQRPTDAVFFISQFDQNNQLIWSTRIEGDDRDDHGTRVHADRFGNLYVAGAGRSDNYPMVDGGGYMDTNSWRLCMLSKFDASRKMVWSTYFPGAFPYKDITTDKDGNMYLASGKYLYKFDTQTRLIWEKEVPTTRMHFWKDIEYDEQNDQLVVLGIMNDSYFGFPTINTVCNGNFFDAGWPNKYPTATGPVFLNLTKDGDFTFLSLADWIAENYEYSEMSVDKQGNAIYLFNFQTLSALYPNPNLTNPGGGAYFDPEGSAYNAEVTSFLMKLTPTTLTAKYQVSPPPGCACTGKITTTVECGSGIYTYLWSNGSTTADIENVCPGNYWVKITDNAKVSRTLYMNVPNPPGSISAVNKTITAENCDKSNGQINIGSVQGGQSPYMYSIDGDAFVATSSFSGLDSGKHIVTIQDQNGCTWRDTSLVGRIKGPQKITLSTLPTGCNVNDGSIKIENVNGGTLPYSFALNNVPGADLFTALAAGNYTISATDATGCSLQVPVEIIKSIPPQAATVIPSADHCNSGIGSFEITNIIGGSSPFSYSLDNTNFSINNILPGLATGMHKLYIRDSRGCVYEQTGLQIQNVSGPTAVQTNIVHAVCGKTTGTISVTGVNGGVAPYLYTMDAGIASSNTVFTGLAAGKHNLKVEDKYHCVYTREFDINYISSPSVKLAPKDTLVCYNQPVVYSANLNGGNQNISWNIPAAGRTATIKVQSEKMIAVSITDDNGCKLTDTAYLHVKACNPPDKCISLPNAFTPNNDGSNDNFGAVVNGCRITEFSLKIFNRFGELIFEGTNPNTKWNGKWKGADQNPGGFVYVCTYVGDDGIRRTNKGSFLLIR